MVDDPWFKPQLVELLHWLISSKPSSALLEMKILIQHSSTSSAPE
jgi:hypothetical protein